MKKQLFIILIACFSLTVTATATQAQTTEKQATVHIDGEVTSPLAINDADLQKFTQTTVVRKDKDGHDHTYSGVLLADILKKAGVTLGSDLKGKNLTKCLLITASDNYQVIFALAELDKAYTDRIIILADQMDGKPLPTGDGPFRVIIQDEKKPARCIKQVTGMKVLFAK
ncbi:molybdopterin-dependent oxidoreductase [Mucilaginibacter sp. McL0603]|uniref:molybdopterin-dependent oxidoreductase n=1 Tax=Mucilaginibacter sp. McL0603 TaxID=3415670 RepID=UPI003CF7C4C0